MGTFHAGDMACKLDHGNLHAQTDTEIGNGLFAGKLGRQHLTLHAAGTESTGHQNAIG